MSELDQNKIDEFRARIMVFIEAGGVALNTFSNSSNDEIIYLKHFIENESEILFKGYEPTSLLGKVMKYLYKIFGAKYQAYNINSLDQNGQTPLHYLYNSVEMVELLVEKLGADINKPNKEGETILMKAGEYGKGEVAEYLINKGAKIDGQDVNGFNVLHKIAQQFKDRDRIGQLKTIELIHQKDQGLLKKLWSQKDNSDKTPKDIAKEKTNRPKTELIDKIRLLTQESYASQVSEGTKKSGPNR